MRAAQTYVDLIEEALAYDPRPGTTLQTILDQIAEGRAKAWFAPNSIAITEDGPRGILHISIGAGDMEELVGNLLTQIREYAVAHGYQDVTAYGRFGWLRALKDYGAKAQGVYFTLGLGNKSDVI